MVPARAAKELNIFFPSVYVIVQIPRKLKNIQARMACIVAKDSPNTVKKGVKI